MRSQIRSLSHLNFRFQSRKSIGLIPSNNLAATRYLLHRGFRTASSLSSSLPFFKLSHARLSLSQSAQTSLRKSKLKNGNTDRDVEISWTIDDAGKEQCWAIVGPASEKAAMVKKGLVQVSLRFGSTKIILKYPFTSVREETETMTRARGVELSSEDKQSQTKELVPPKEKPSMSQYTIRDAESYPK